MVFNGPSIYPNLMFFVFSIKSVEDIYDFLSILVFLAAVEAAMIDVMKVLCDEMKFTPAEITKS